MSISKDELIENFLNAANEGDIETLANCLKDRRITIDQRNENGTTALICAAANGQAEAVRYLLDLGANPNLADDSDDSAISIAKENGEEEVLSLLTEWSLMGSTKLVHVETSDIASIALKEIFNLESRERIVIVTQLDSNGDESDKETILPPVSFNTLPERMLEKIFEKFTALGGKADKTFVVHNQTRIEKKLPSPGLGKTE